jgi:hypothetical protein
VTVLLRTVVVVSVSFILFIFTGCNKGEVKDVIVLKAGPHLFIDDYLIAEQSFLSRTVNHPQKLPEPIVTGKTGGDNNFQPYMTVLKDPQTGRFRIWYNSFIDAGHSHIAYMESEDGINWIRPHRVLKDPHPIEYGVSVVDQGIDYPNPEQRYLFAAYNLDGMHISTSPDGLIWMALRPEAVLKHNHDITSLHWDPIRKQYLAIVSVWKRNEEWNDNQRTPNQSVSKDLINWEDLWPIMYGKIGAPIERGETQFYAMSGVLARGDLLIGLVKILRDDLNATPGKTGKEMGDLKRKAAGLGYTVLAWSRDGRTWDRDHEPFLDRNHVPETWDHAFAWGDEQIIVGDETYVYYGGYAHGHKVNRFEERQIGLAKMPVDRYVSREASINLGTLRTKPIALKGNVITVNANVVGEMRIRLVDPSGSPVTGFEWVDIRGDDSAHRIDWKGDLASLRDKPVQIEFQLKNAQLFGFTLN